MPFHQVLTPSYFSLAGQFYEQINGVAMVSPISPVITIFFMEDIEEMALDMAAHNPLCSFRYVDNNFVSMPHGPDRERALLDHLNSVHQNVQFTMETERNGQLPFLDIDIYRRPDGTLGQKLS
jgi:hypothetical protein